MNATLQTLTAAPRHATIYLTDPRRPHDVLEIAQVTIEPAHFTYDGKAVMKFEYGGRTEFAARLTTRRHGTVWLAL